MGTQRLILWLVMWWRRGNVRPIAFNIDALTPNAVHLSITETKNGGLFHESWMTARDARKIAHALFTAANIAHPPQRR